MTIDAVNGGRAYLIGTENRHQDRQQFTHDGKKLVFRQVRPNKLGKDLHGAMNGVGRPRQQELDEEVEQVWIFIRPVAVGYRR